jgi:hypothetical protein
VDCWDANEAGVLTRDASQLSAEVLAQADVAAYVSANGADALIDLAHYDVGETPADHPSVIYHSPNHPGYAALRALIASYRAGLFNCGFPTSCLTGVRGGLTWLQGDECSVAAGCMDFSASTRCPNDGLLTVTAIARGEESFTDLNGNGVLDFQDSNGNGRHDDASVEPLLEDGTTPPTDPDARLQAFRDIVVDMPEPTLDKNDNCYYDDYDDVERLSTWSKIQIGDLYIDEDGDGLYGYSIEDNQGNVVERRLTNGTWDRDKQLFFQTHMLSLAEGPYFEYGQPCAGPSPGGVPDTQCTVAAANGGQLAVCYEYGPGVYLAPDCVPDVNEVVTAGETIRLSYRYVDSNGNCWSPGLDAFTHVFESFNLTDLGAAGRTYGLSECGLSNAGRSTSQPWCEEAPSLGGTLTNISATPQCLRDFVSFDQYDIGSMTIHLHGAIGADQDIDYLSDTFAFQVECPYCGDGVVTPPEECDDALDPVNCNFCTAVTP